MADALRNLRSLLPRFVTRALLPSVAVALWTTLFMQGGARGVVMGVITGLFMVRLFFMVVDYQRRASGAPFRPLPMVRMAGPMMEMPPRDIAMLPAPPAPGSVEVKAWDWTEAHPDEMRSHAGRWAVVDPAQGVVLSRQTYPQAQEALVARKLEGKATVMMVATEAAFVHRAVKEWMDRNHCWVGIVHAGRHVAVSPERGIVAIADSNDEAVAKMREAGLREHLDACIFKMEPLRGAQARWREHSDWVESHRTEVLSHLGMWFALGPPAEDPAGSLCILATADTYVGLAEACGAAGITDFSGMWYPRWLAEGFKEGADHQPRG